jgi:hypothetical protein
VGCDSSYVDGVRVVVYKQDRLNPSFSKKGFLRVGIYLSRYRDGLLAVRPGLDSRQEQDIFVCSAAPRPALRPTHTPIQ